MKNTAVLFSVVWILATGVMWAQDSRGTAQASFSGGKVEIEYGRPSLNGRDMLSRLPVGRSWRMGMNAATTLTSEVTLEFGGEAVMPGTYKLTAKRVGDDDWHLIISNDSGSTEVPLVSSSAEEPVETLSIELEEKNATLGEFRMAWGELAVNTTFSVK